GICQPAACCETVKVGMQKEGLVPCVERCNDAGLCSEVFVVAEEFKEGVCGACEEYIGHDLYVERP
ncbi:MAG: hypothetical protein SWO11_16175, partial [Thermodesulfobacteriota bacterium]|nr:hypothetical protein [Thermodesulfobacteriota bacterium]